jgi:dihydropyrimidinase
VLDLVIRGDKVVTPQGVGEFDVGIKDGKIALIATAGSLKADIAHRMIDASGKIVMPGGIDPHIHSYIHWPVPTNLDGSSWMTARPSVVSKAALFGGTTTLIDFARLAAGDTIQGALEKRDKDWKAQCHTDYSFHITVGGKLSPQIYAQLGEAIRSGYPTIKMFTTNTMPQRQGNMIGMGDMWEVFQVAAREGGLCAIHGEDNDIVMHMYEKLIREGRTGFEHIAEVHNALSENLSFRRVIRLAESVPGAAIYFMHVSAGTGVQAIRDARGRGNPVYGETLHQYLMYTVEDYKKPNGQIYHTFPSLKYKADQAALWSATHDGVIQTVATDDICCSLADKTQGKRIDDLIGGNAGVEPRVAVMYTEMVGRRGYTLQKFVDHTSTNAAKIMGLYPSKGAIAAGSDADFAILDTSKKFTLRKEMLHESDYSPWEGHEVHAWPSMTILRGKVVVENGTFHGDQRDGQYLLRKIPDAIRSGRLS